MAIVQTPQNWIKNIILMGLFAVLAACGGGGGNDETPPPTTDTTPNTFSFSSVANAEPGAIVISESVTVSGINAAAPISVSGAEYRIGDGDYTSAAGTINNNQRVNVRVTAANAGNTPVEATLVIGGVNGIFTVTTRPDDTTPDTFSFSAITGAQVSSQITSSPVMITGINTATAISITGGEYAIDGGTFTTAPGTVTNNQNVIIKLTSSSDTNTETVAELTIGDETGTFSVTTVPDITPTDFSFVAALDVAPGSEQTSNAITVADIDIPVAISINGGEYSIDGGDYTAEAGTVSEGQAVTVITTAANSLETSKEVTLTIGSLTATYLVTTFADNLAPTAEFMFPPPVSMTEGTTLLVRGKISDDFSEITGAQITVNDNEPQDLALTANDDGSSSWQVEINLDTGENTIVVSTTDSAGNSELNAAQVNVRQDATLGSFPDADNPIPVPRALAIDRLNGRNRLLVSDDFVAKLFAVNLNTGSRILLTDFSEVSLVGITDMLLNEDEGVLLVRDDGSRIATIKLDDISQINSYLPPDIGTGFVFTFDDAASRKLIAVNSDNGNIVNISLDFSSASIISDNTNLTQGNPIPIMSRGITFDKSNQRYLVTSYEDQTIYSIDSITGTREIFSNNEIGEGDDFSSPGVGFLRALKVDEEGQRILVLERTTGQIYEVDMNGNRGILSSPTIPNSLNPMERLHSLAVNSFDSYAYVTDELAVGIFAVDMVTGHRVYFSKN